MEVNLWGKIDKDKNNKWIDKLLLFNNNLSWEEIRILRKSIPIRCENDKINLICDICGKSYETNFRNIEYQLRYSKFLVDIFVCSGKTSECSKEKKKRLLTYRKSIDDSPATGHIVSDEQKERYLKTMKNIGVYETNAKMRKGKYINELYGKEKADEIRKKNGR